MLGVILLFLLFALPGGILGGLLNLKIIRRRHPARV